MAQENPGLRDQDSRPYREESITADFSKFVVQRILPQLRFVPKKVDKKSSIAVYVAHNLITAGLRLTAIGDPRNNNQSGASLRKQVWDAFEAAGFLTKCTGSEQSKRVTLYYATTKLLDLNAEWELNTLVQLELIRNTEVAEASDMALVVIRTGKMDPATGELLPDDKRKQPQTLRDYLAKSVAKDFLGNPDPRAIDECLDYFRYFEDLLEWINEVNTNHHFKAYYRDKETGRRRMCPVNPCLRQIHAGHFNNGCRLYTWGDFGGQSLPKALRKTMKIDKESVCELDFSAMHPMMAHHLLGFEVQGDVYRPDLILPRFYALPNASESKRLILRDFVKRATNIMFNVSSRGKANSAVGKMLYEHRDGDFLYKVLKMEGLTPAGAVDAIVKAQPLIADTFFKEAGLELMTMDGRIMFDILLRLTGKNIPALAIHDALVCKSSDREIVTKTMIERYEERCGFKPLIRVVYDNGKAD